MLLATIGTFSYSALHKPYAHQSDITLPSVKDNDKETYSTDDVKKIVGSLDGKNLKKHLGYDPQVEYFIPSQDKTIVDGVPQIFCHGFGMVSPLDKTYLTDRIQKYGSDTFPGGAIVFNFNDAHHPALAQDSDIMALILIMHELYKKGLKGFILHGHSRGADVIVNALVMLLFPNTTWKNIFEQSGITKHDRINIMQAIRNNGIILDDPMMGGKLAELDFAKGSTIKKMSFPLIRHGMPFIYRGYRPWRIHAHTSVEKLKNFGFTILLLYQATNRTLLFQEPRIEFYQNLKKGNNVSLVLADDGGHFHNYATYRKIIHAFNKRCGGFYKENLITTESEEVLDRSVDLQNDQDIKKFIDNYVYL